MVGVIIGFGDQGEGRLPNRFYYSTIYLRCLEQGQLIYDKPAVRSYRFDASFSFLGQDFLPSFLRSFPLSFVRSDTGFFCISIVSQIGAHEVWMGMEGDHDNYDGDRDQATPTPARLAALIIKMSQ